MKRILPIFVLVVLFIIPVFSQEKVKIKKKEYFTTDVDFKNAWKNFKKGNKYFKQDKKGSYQMAVDFLKTAADYNPDYAKLNYELGISYIKVHDEKNAYKHIQTAFDLDPNVAEDIHFWLGRVYHLNSKYDLAIEEYKTYRDGLPEKQRKKKIDYINKFIIECEDGIKLSQSPKSVIIDNLGGKVNTPYPEYSPVFAPYDSIVFYTSRRPNTTGEKRNRTVSNEFYEDVFYTSALNGAWESPEQMQKPINSKGNDASVAVSPDGKGLLVYRGKKNGGDIYISFKDIKNNGDEKWSNPKQVIRKINKKKYRETSLTFNHDSSVVYFVSNRNGGVGGKDIWMTYRRGNSNSGWTKPVNIGSNINTIYDEESVFLLGNDSILYFASKGHNTIGGYDIFRSFLLPDKRWTEPENIGVPFNTPDDDMFIFVNKNKKTGYFTSSGQKDNYGDLDLYSFFIFTPKKLINDSDDDLIAYIKSPVNELYMEDPVSIKTMRMTVLKGTVTEYQTGKPLYATIEIIDNSTQEVIQTLKTNATTGAYTVMLNSGKDYGFAVVADGYMFYSENFNIPVATGYQEVEKNVQLMPINAGAKVVLRNVFFDTGKSNLRPESYPELNRLAEAFKQFPNLVVEISGHTDNRGKDAYNNKLSQNRAQAVVDYLISIGVPKNQLIAKGYGKAQPVAPNTTDEGRQLNRRVEAKVISN